MVKFNENGQGFFTFQEFEENKIVNEFFSNYESEKVATYYKKQLYKIVGYHSKFNKNVSLNSIKRINWVHEKYYFIVFYEDDYYHYDFTRMEWF